MSVKQVNLYEMWEPKHHDVLCSKHFGKKCLTGRTLLSIQFGLKYMSVHGVNDLEKCPVRISKNEALTPLPVVGPLFISLLLFHLSRVLLGAWRFGLFRCVYSSFHYRLDLIREPFIGCFTLFSQFSLVCFIIM